jgi:protein-tyrosine phosphatase
MYSVLFVCTANICRSPLAMGILRSQVLESKEWKIESAGVWARDGYPVHKFVHFLLMEKGINLSQHSSRKISKDILEQFNLILVMELGQKEGIKIAFPDAAEKVYLLTEMIDQRYDIVDPVNGDMIDFKETAKEIEHILIDGFDQIRHLAGRDLSKTYV